MGKINVLDSSVFNRIAAGEVVERPASIVKELVENSLDAGSTQIRIEVLEGGIKQIKVSDNGCGIEPEDVEVAFLPHATSKIHSIDDLEQIGTLGFRGEALASIASVSQVELTSKVASFDTGRRVKIDGGKLIENIETASPNGTYITVNNLFFNVPARQKFLKTASREESEITNLVARFILANPKVSFVYFADKKEVYRSSGKNLEEALFTVYGKSILENVVPFESKVGAITLSGFLGKPNYSKSNRTYQTLVINDRYVINSVISAASYGAYENYLMKGKFPFFVIHMNMPLDSVDVNVHPNKLDVKFENSQTIYGIIYNAISKALMNANNILKVETKVEQTAPIFTPTINLSQIKEQTTGVSFNTTTQPAKEVEIDVEDEQEQKTSVEERVIEEKQQLLDSLLKVTSGFVSENTLKENGSVLTSAFHREFNSYSAPIVKTEQTHIFENITKDDSSIIMVGKVFNTYLMVEKEGSLFVIDQHAAHERLLYDKFSEQINNKHISLQGLLIPHIVTVNHLEEVFLKENLEKINALGFEMEPFGSLSFKISSIPSVLSGMNLDLFFNEILKDMTALNKVKTSDLIIDALKQASCKAAVKAGNNLSRLEVITLFDLMEKTNMTLLCPHGRPVVVEVTRKEMDKWFKRIL